MDVKSHGTLIFGADLRLFHISPVSSSRLEDDPLATINWLTVIMYIEIILQFVFIVSGPRVYFVDDTRHLFGYTLVVSHSDTCR